MCADRYPPPDQWNYGFHDLVDIENNDNPGMAAAGAAAAANGQLVPNNNGIPVIYIHPPPSPPPPPPPLQPQINQSLVIPELRVAIAAAVANPVNIQVPQCIRQAVAQAAQQHQANNNQALPYAINLLDIDRPGHLLYIAVPIGGHMDDNPWPRILVLQTVDYVQPIVL
ncbi:ecdysone-induced protein 75B-like [Oppia nitens]|uniref:ecdysone-induced protein 75B-like n=1 Tax=Oppia nitens TaxID=1686743 RepID=UPI0023DC73EF|nr:ecdysone-induced protein 75B-like [Oppia nitens]